MDNLIRHYECPEVFEKRELQAFFEAQPILYVFKYHMDDFLKIPKIKPQNKHDNNSVYLKLLNFIENEVVFYRLGVDAQKTCEQYLLLCLLQSLTSRFSSWEEDENNNSWYSAYDLFENFSKILNSLFIFGSGEYYHADLINKKHMRELFLQVVNIYLYTGFLKKKVEMISENNKHTFYSLAGAQKNINNFFLNIKLHLEQPSVIGGGSLKHTCGLHYLSTNKVFRENLKSSKCFKLNNSTVWEKLRNLTLELDATMYDVVYEELLSEYSLDKVDPLKHVIGLYLKNKNMQHIKLFQKKSSEYYNLIIFFYLKRFPQLFGKKLYFSYFFDFRGRLYADSVISPTGSKIFRWLYNYGLYDTVELSTREEVFSDVLPNSIQSILDNSNLLKFYPNLNVKNKIHICVIRTVFFEMGKLLKDSIVHEKCGILVEQDFIQLGIKIFNALSTNCPKINFKFVLNDRLEVLYLLNILKSFNNGLAVKYIIYKDATASAIQLLLVLLGADNLMNYKICNLSDDTHWYDTYYFIIKKFKETFIINEVSKDYFVRKHLKKTIMTYNYSATMYTCWKEFSSELNLSEEDYLKIFEDFKKFYSYLKQIFDNTSFFKKTSTSILDSLKLNLNSTKEIRVFTVDMSEASLEYKKMLTTRLEKRHKNIRSVMSFRDPSEELDFKKIDQSLRPNLIHNVDATYTRIIIWRLKYAIITIHDSFGIDILNTDELIITANYAMNLLRDGLGHPDDISKTLHSKFILL